MSAQPFPPIDGRASLPKASAPVAPRWHARFGGPPRRTVLLGLTGSVLLVLGGLGAGGVLVRDPVLTNSVLGFWRYGHGREMATALVYLGVGLLVWAWVRLGRDVLADRVSGRVVVSTAAVWLAPMLVAPPLFTRDVFSYLAQGTLPLRGHDPYQVGPDVLGDVLSENVHYFWQDTPAPYGPLFILLAKGMAWLFSATGQSMIVGVVGWRLLLLSGLLLLVWALPELTRRLGGRVPVALWVAVANPVTVIHLVGGIHNDLLVVGLLAAGSLFALRGRHVTAIALVTCAMAVKATAGVALPFLVLVWAARLPGSSRVRLAKATAAGLGVFGVVFAFWTLVAGFGLGWLPALSAPSMIVNWLSMPTAAGELAFTAVNLVAEVDKQPFVNVARILGAAVLLVIAVRQWWAARDGGPNAVRQAGVVLLAVAVLSPTMLPWYVSWGMALLAMTAWTPRGLAYVVFGSVWLLVVYYPDGETALYNWPYLAVCALLAGLAAVSLLRPDPLHLAAAARAPASPRREPARTRRSRPPL
ncbi:polyprenol phosphomannose-dependent alpha 1,6 mannosyltransferase MptB [Pseudonocardia sp. KRD-184]|uniref:Polyprenol phosphomannose-dependent alpha 1,6 mannosyltransferase MptB n=2 Tax=Pseudonocardia oceani TaxID=2792013 RepID=A0ABS6U2X0_9PSEU|nr:polyprenol phosphomannose-dependent alpha 1,6 mannosyltransferase MptB [Pseudonocardia oceani]MBW0121935.1 polyprenol phosphomannose-dependent alpha 1,6 mannosyltransferase MptB [Pseudonocardia oceani]MBW0126511.1 polyprenol phosphomannose-dependent alpha 1,6 mannosyltransferase MptB [Pseudonocardia oceani]